MRINGVDIVGRGNDLHIVVNGDKVTINGKEVDGSIVGLPQSRTLKIEVSEGELVSVTTDGPVECGTVNGPVRANGSVKCGNVTGNADAGGSMQCGNVGGHAKSGGSMQCGNISGNASAGGSMRRA